MSYFKMTYLALESIVKRHYRFLSIVVLTDTVLLAKNAC